MKKFSSGFWLFVVTILVVSYAYFFEYKKRNEDEKAKSAESLIFKFKKDDLKSIKLVRKNEILQFVRQPDSSWKIVSPIQDGVEALPFGRWVDSLLEEKSEMSFGEEIFQWKMYGLDKPQGSIELSTEDQTEIVEIGSPAVANQIYLRVDHKDEITLGHNTWEQYVKKEPKDFRSKDILRSHGREIEKIVIKNSAHRLALEKQEGEWKIPGISYELDTRALKGFETQVLNMKAQEVVSESKTPKKLISYGLHTPEAELEIYYQNELKPVIIRMSEKVTKNGKSVSKDSYISNSELPYIFKSFSNFPKSYSKKLTYFRERAKPFQFSSGDVKTVVAHEGQWIATLEQVEEGQWRLIKSTADQEDQTTGETVNQIEVAGLIHTLESLRVKEFLGTKSSFSSQKRYILKNSKGDVLLDLQVGEKTKSNGTKVKVAGTQGILSIEDSAASTMPTQKLIEAKK